MKQLEPSPFPSLAEVIRYLANAFDTKCANKKIDDIVRESITSPAQLNELIDETILLPLESINERLAEVVRDLLNDFLDSYKSLVSSVNVHGLSRDEVMIVLTHWAWEDWITKLVTYPITHFGMPEGFALRDRSDGSMVATVIGLSGTSSSWNKFEESLEKEEKDRLRTWFKSTHLPSLQYIKLLGNGKSDYWKKTRSSFAIARAFDFMKKDAFRLLSNSNHSSIDYIQLLSSESFEFTKAIKFIQASKEKHYIEIMPSIAFINSYLFIGIDKATKNDTKQKIDFMRNWLGEKDDRLVRYWIARSEAYWHVYSGDLESANTSLEEAFEYGLFSIGAELQQLIFSARAVAANLKQPDKVFLKKLKWAGVTFNFDANQTESEGLKNKFSEHIEDWEVESWARSFYRVFPKDRFYDGVELPVQKASGVIKVDLKSVKPDFNNPNKIIKVGEGGATQRYPQLIWFLILENYAVVKRLLVCGADVNKANSVGDTSVLVAIQALNPTLPSSSAMDERYWQLISRYPLHEKTVNTRTQKKRLTPLSAAIETGRPDIVEKLLSMGANPNQKAHATLLTPLYICISILMEARSLEKHNKLLQPDSNRPVNLDVIKRYMPGWVSSNQEAIKVGKDLKAQINSPLGMAVNLVRAERFKKYIQANNMEKIAIMLLEAGANPNAKHTFPINGYTPLMLAVEANEVDLFMELIKYGGDPHQTFIDPISGRVSDCKTIAFGRGSKDIIQVCIQNKLW